MLVRLEPTFHLKKKTLHLHFLSNLSILKDPNKVLKSWSKIWIFIGSFELNFETFRHFQTNFLTVAFFIKSWLNLNFDSSFKFNIWHANFTTERKVWTLQIKWTWELHYYKFGPLKCHANKVWYFNITKEHSISKYLTIFLFFLLSFELKA